MTNHDIDQILRDLGTVVAPSGVKASTLEGELLVIRPTRSDKMTTEIGISDVFFAETLVAFPDTTEEPPYRNVGEIPYFWTVTRRQLQQWHDAPQTWFVARLTRQKRDPESAKSPAYIFVAATSEEKAMGAKVIQRHMSDPIPVEQPDTDDAPF